MNSESESGSDGDREGSNNTALDLSFLSVFLTEDLKSYRDLSKRTVKTLHPSVTQLAPAVPDNVYDIVQRDTSIALPIHRVLLQHAKES